MTEKIIKIIVGILLTVLFVMLLWNWVMVDIFRLPTISYLQALGLYILPKLLIHKYNNSED